MSEPPAEYQVDPLPTIAREMADELRRSPCRKPHKLGEPCRRCDPLAKFDVWWARQSIVQTPATAAREALRRHRVHQNCQTCVCRESLENGGDE